MLVALMLLILQPNCEIKIMQSSLKVKHAQEHYSNVENKCINVVDTVLDNIRIMKLNYNRKFQFQ